MAASEFWSYVLGAVIVLLFILLTEQVVIR
jgi:hypothetical protein